MFKISNEHYKTNCRYSYVFIINVDQANDVFLFIVVVQFCLFLVQYPFACQETVPL